MPEKVRPLQKDMFTGKWVDNRTRRQKKKDKAREAPQQMLMFSQREIAQVGVNARPQFSLSPKTQLRLLYPDYRTPEEIQRDRENASLKQNGKLWSDEQLSEEISPSIEILTKILQEDPYHILAWATMLYFLEVSLL